ncbi:MAG TPA: prolipoprotein diacylglyceryl transferase [Candidatus Acidoferrales bacterium]|nr:prolipoprotein diacylglyceryl transferase [Candidatus Acidoferrales bacterium]
MHPILGSVPTPWGSVTIYSYGVLVSIGVLLALFYSRYYGRHAGIDPDRVWNLGVYMVLAALIVAKLWLVVVEADYYWRHPREIVTRGTLQSGGTFYGGLIGAILVLVLYRYFQRIPFLPYADAYAAGLPLGHAIGRLGCFAAGCCYGKPTWLPWGVTFTSPAAASLVGTPLNVPLHPTQLYESFAEFLNFAILICLARKQRFKGEIFAAFLLLYGFERGLIEFVRGDPDRTLFLRGRFSLMQVVSLGLILLGAWMWRRGVKSVAHTAHPEPAAARQ